MDPPPAPALTAVSSAPHLPCAADSIQSSPRSRTTGSWDDTVPPVPGAPKLRLMCSYGGHIVPRPHDKSLCYVGGDTRMVLVDRNISLAGLSARLAKTLFLNNKPFSLKYQLPNEDLDSLISLAGDEDLENMIEEYDRLCVAAGAGGKGSRLRLFVFPAKSESIASIGSLLDNSVKSDEWFLSALNGSRMLSGGFSDSASVNCLLGLENDVVAANNNELGISRGLMDSEFGNRKNVKTSNQDVHSVPDSPLMETTSSFGSANSNPSLANLPPIRVREEVGGIRAQDQRLGIEEQFAQISVSTAENFAVMTSPPPPIPTTIIASMHVQSTMNSSAPVAGDFPGRAVSDDERSDHSAPVGLYRNPPQQQSQVQQQQKPGGGADFPGPGLQPSDGSLPNATPRSNQMVYQEAVQVSSGDNKISANKVDPRNNLMYPNTAQDHLQKQVQDSGYMVQPQIEPQHYPYQQSFVHNGTHYVIQQVGNPMPIPPYYPVYPPPHQQQVQHPHHQPIPFHPQQYQRPVYIVQAPQPPQGYHMSMQHQTYPEGTAVIHTGHPQTPPNPSRVLPNLNGVPDPANAFSNNPNASRAASPHPEVSSAIYRATSTGSQPVAPNLPLKQMVNYSKVSHQPQATSAANPTYNYEIPDPARAQIYYTQPLAPSLISQYQTMSSAQVLEASIQPQNDSISMKPSEVRN
ncbi:unnamed protein product [Rhodiola kirilowii]